MSQASSHLSRRMRFGRRHRNLPYIAAKNEVSDRRISFGTRMASVGPKAAGMPVMSIIHFAVLVLATSYVVFALLHHLA